MYLANVDFFGAIKEGAILINIARGALIEDAESQEQGLRYVGPAKGGGKSRRRF